MLKYIFIATIVLLLIFNVICLNKIKKSDDVQHDIVRSYKHLIDVHNDLIAVTSESFLYEDQKLQKNLFVCTEKNDSIPICDIFGGRLKLVMRYTVESCESCVEKEIELLKKTFEGKYDNIVILTNHEHSQDMIAFKRKHQLNSAIYSIRDTNLNLNNNNVCFFVSDNSLLIKSFLIPTPFCPDLTEHYLNIMVKKYFDVYEK
ncbi:MAG: hypothetical protein LBK58_01895 [Prevotellaceae bacterium]|jgi:hypothetical protein|nr:hypothetical protein [Prevotellaceae bacterium]